MAVRYNHVEAGVNSRLDTLQAAILNVKLRYLNDYTRRRNEVADFYDSKLGLVPGLTIPHRDPRSTHVFHQYTVQTARRDALREHLEGHGIPTMIYYPVPLHLQKAYRRPGAGQGLFPVTEQLSATVLSLPIHTEMTAAELDFICTTIKNFF